jgi:hypothetical protein
MELTMTDQHTLALQRHFDWCRESVLQGRRSLAWFETNGSSSANGADTTQETKALLARVIENLEKHLKDHDQALPE